MNGKWKYSTYTTRNIFQLLKMEFEGKWMNSENILSDSETTTKAKTRPPSYVGLICKQVEVWVWNDIVKETKQGS